MVGSSVLLDGGAGADRSELDFQRLVDTVSAIGGEGNDQIGSGSAASFSIDAGVGDDSVTIDSSSLSQTITLGNGADTLRLISRTLTYAVGNAITVTDFAVNADRVMLTEFLAGALIQLASMRLWLRAYDSTA